MDLLDYYERNFYLLGGVMSELTDLEICKRIAEIEGKTLSHEWDCSISGVFIVAGDGDLSVYNPLTDDALCFRLMVKYEISVNFIECPACSGKAYYTHEPKNYTDYSVTPNRAICLAIIEAHKD